MTLCAGTCTHSGIMSCTIRLSAPILKFRTANQVKQTLLHEMIHAFLFITNPSACINDGGHGAQFQKLMRQINAITALNITIFHNFHDEVNHYRQHIWRCDGPCKFRPPFYGYVKRAMNRKPQPADSWFKQHQRSCGGEFIKIGNPQKNPIKTNKNKKKKQIQKGQLNSNRHIQDYFLPKKNSIQKHVCQKTKQKSIFSKGTAKTIAQYQQQIAKQMQYEQN